MALAAAAAFAAGFLSTLHAATLSSAAETVPEIRIAQPLH